MALHLYLDDCADSRLLVELLTQAGHLVVRPADAGTTGNAYVAHLAYARQHGLILVTKDADDFEALHEHDSTHPGIFGIYQDNDRTRDMTQAEIVAAIARIEAAALLGYPIAGQFHVLNNWR